VLTIHEDYFLLTGGIERWLYRVARKHAGSQETGWSFTMRQLYDKSGSAARPSDFAIDIRRVVQANQLPEYELAIRRNEEGEEIVMFVHRKHLPLVHSRHELPRRADRRRTSGIYAAAWSLNGLLADDSGDQAQPASVDSIGRIGAVVSDDQAHEASDE
jgi:plasmid replication initiation protein